MELSKRSQRKINSIVEHAALLFERHGFNKVTMESVAQYANVSKVTLYKYFKDKQTLYEHILVQGWDTLHDDVKTIIMDLIPYKEKVYSLFQCHVDHHFNDSKPHYDNDVILSIETTKYRNKHKARMKRLRQKLYNQARMEEFVSDSIEDSVLEAMFHITLDGLLSQHTRIMRLSEQEQDGLYQTLYAGIINEK